MGVVDSNQIKFIVMFTKHYTCTFIEIKINVPLYFVMLPNLAVKKVLTFF